MNRRQKKSILRHFSLNKSISDIAQFVDLDRSVVRKFLEENEIDVASKAKYLLLEIEQEETAELSKANEDQDFNIEAPEFKSQPSFYEGNFDRTKAIKNNNSSKEKIPMELQHKFRSDIRMFPWNVLVTKWCNRLNLTEEELREQAKLLAPSFMRKGD